MTDLRPHIKAHGTAGTVADHIKAGGKVRQRDGREPKRIPTVMGGFIYGTDADGAEREWWHDGLLNSWETGPLDLLPVEPPAAGQPVAWRSPGIDNYTDFNITSVKDTADRWARDGRTVEPLYTAPAGDGLVAGLRKIEDIHVRNFGRQDEKLADILPIVRALLAKHGGGNG